MNKLNFLFCNCTTIFVSCCLGINIASGAIAQPANPLEIDRSDPLIPTGYGKRELSSFEKYRLQKKIVELDKAAKDELDKGNVSLARELWYRQLRLVRIINTRAEIKALGKIGAIAWKENLTDDVRNIARRLGEIQTAKTKDKNTAFELLNDLATAYKSVRYIDKAIDVYEQISLDKTNKANKDKIAERLGELYLDIFDYDRAAKIYQQQLKDNIAPEQQETILKTLAQIYNRTEQFKRAIAIKQQLTEYYISKKQPKKVPAINIAIAQDYEASKQVPKAISVYQQAFNTALENAQLAIASEALAQMGKLQQEKNTKQAIATYKKLITVQQQAYNYYGLTDTYDTLGAIYLKSNNPNKAKQFFQQGLDIAVTLDYKVQYFRDRLKSIDP